MLIVVRHGHPVLFPDSTEAGQLRGEILADLDGGPNQHGVKTGWIIDKQLRPRVPAEDGVLHPVSRGRDVEALAIPVVPVGAQVRAPVAADPGDDDVTRLSEDRLDLVGRCHPLTLSGPPVWPADALDQGGRFGSSMRVTSLRLQRPVGVAAVLDAKDDHFARIFADAVENAVGAPPGGPHASQVITQWLADSVWPADQRGSQELDHGGGDRLRQLPGQGTACWRGKGEFVVVLAGHRRSWRMASTPRTTSPRA